MKDAGGRGALTSNNGHLARLSITPAHLLRRRCRLADRKRHTAVSPCPWQRLPLQLMLAGKSRSIGDDRALHQNDHRTPVSGRG